MLGFNLGDDKVILSQLGKAGEEYFNLTTEKVGELGHPILGSI